MSEAKYLRFLRTKEGLANYTILKPIGKGGFGQVKLVRRKHDGRVYALKQLSKGGLKEWKTASLAWIRTERDVLAEHDSEWFVKLYTAFQDGTSLYLLMEYLPCGDLWSLLHREGRFADRAAAFYAAEIVMAIGALHELGYIHRDLKPGNILLDRRGHIRLADFGCAKGRREAHDGEYYRDLVDSASPSGPTQNGYSFETSPAVGSNIHNDRRFMAYSRVGTR
ncbi:kinase-like domain-containing protein [Parachaetomium inaequale]|uniref:non-specific serine/threonine protein kinase n=1 Tax=Parachaetomium inaequale TaxID=2588326 RepID=A0AAN6SUU0_9PEZI|nr:kinase-like domain-containing protein [Parachaetomium inaequale]